ncbi:hypothetical protein CDL12_10325 [Handroanthus impetiginosus]|uniref:Uncharacterized protein n=1 Tax=Handroanthus impetiginosus TaxID=429701 RepID=A0A2G9HI95_9LAMI|nr:hypothetical protein CDL12_10325 [Handroanthus impetiginosus]
MNFLMLRSTTQTATLERQSVIETRAEPNYTLKKATTLGGLIGEDKFPEVTSSESHNSVTDDFGDENGSMAGPSGKSNSQVDSHVDVTEDDGWLIIPNKKIPDNWTEAPDILSYRCLDRNFVFPGEEVQILACLSAYKQDMEIITPFKVAAVMHKNGIGQSPPKQNGNVEGITDPVSQDVDSDISHQNNQYGETMIAGNIDSQIDISTGESLLRMEDHRRQTEQLLQRFRNSHFFARIAESNEPLWSKRRPQDAHNLSETSEGKMTEDSSETANTLKTKNPISAVVDRGEFDARMSGGVARGAVGCCSLSNGDIVALLQVNVGVEFMRDPILEILQFEEYHERIPTPENDPILISLNHDPYGELLKWLLPLNNSLPPSARPLSPPMLSSSSSIRSTSTKPTISNSSGSQLFSFGHFRSYSMSSLPPSSTPPPQGITTPNTKPSFDPEDWNQFSFRKFAQSGKGGNEGLLSFRGVQLEPDRFSVRCGLEGIFTPGRRWRRKIELIQLVEIHSFSVDCNSDDLLCVHLKNVSPANAPDIVVFIDSITIVFEEAPKDGPPLCLPIACAEAGNDYSLPNLALRRGEEHSFILKPATTLWKHPRGLTDGNLRPPSSSAGSATSSSRYSSNIEGRHSGSPADQYAILVSCRCNYAESRLFFKQSTSWRPRISRDLVISVASEMSRQSFGSDGTHLPVQVLTLQASNMTFDDLTMTLLAPASFSSSSVMSLSNSPSLPLTPLAASAELAETVNTDMAGAAVQWLSSVSLNQEQNAEDGPQSVSSNEQPAPISDVVPHNDMGCTHLWMQSRVPLGCVPSQSTATIKLEVLPLTDGIITLDSLKIDAKEKGLTYIPEHPLKINATSIIATSVA